MSEKELTCNRVPRCCNPNMRPNQMKLYVCPTTGGCVKVLVPSSETVHGLKIAISRKIRIPTERINLLFKNKILKSGTLVDNQVLTDSRLTLLPNMTSGMAFQKQDSSVMQALESLSESQVNDFLSGRAPLLLAMRLGDHMMFVQLQLSTAQCINRRQRGQQQQQQQSQVTSPAVQHPVLPQTPTNPASLAEASRNLSQKLRDLTHMSGHTKVGETAQVTVSSRVPTPSAPIPATPEPCSNQGAVIDSMQHLGQGVYSGTFSGTLDPTLQDYEGRPRKDIGTIVHILNDLLGSSPHYNSCRPFVLEQTAVSHTQRAHTEVKGVSRVKVNENSKPEDYVMRGKVRQLQIMMQERRQRRKARREMKAPYHWQSNSGATNQQEPFCHQTTSVDTMGANSTGLNTETNQMEIPNNIESASYRNMEQETVAV